MEDLIQQVVLCINCDAGLHALCTKKRCPCSCRPSEPPKPTWSLHRGIVRALKREGCRIDDFKNEMRRIAAERFPEDTGEDISSMVTKVPDAYMLNEDEREITVYEVEISNPLTDKKLLWYVDLWFLFDYEDWEFKLMVIDRFCRSVEVPLATIYYTTLGFEHPGH